MSKVTKVLVCGGRDYALGQQKADQEHIFAVLDQMQAYYRKVFIIHGGAPGADTFAGIWADDRSVHCARVPALWRTRGGAAGPQRNSAMLLLEPDIVVAFPGGAGTANMKQQAREAGIPVYEV